MAKTSNITFTGLFIPNMLGTFSVIRGFASLRDLARVSVPFGMRDIPGGGLVQGHQRELDERHAREIVQYLGGPSERFLPEVILSVRLGQGFPAPETGVTTVYVPANEADIEAMAGMTAKRLTAPSFSGRRPYDIMQLVVNEKLLPLVRERCLIRRVDGNHRLEKASDLQEDPASVNRYVTSFCMVLLFPPEYEPHNYTESLIFHTINSTAIPLQSEHALKLILSQDPGNALPPETEYQLNPTLHLTRLLRDQSQKATEPIRNRLGKQPLTSFHQTARSMVDLAPPQFENAAEQRTFAEDLFSGLSDILTRLSSAHPTLCKAPFFLDLAARVWQQTKAEDEDHNAHLDKAVDYLADLGTWLGKEGFDELQEGQTLSAQILNIYENVRRDFPKNVFMVRWYASGGTQEQKRNADLRYETIERALKELKGEVNISLNLIDLGSDVGGTELIHPKMYANLVSSDIVMVDLTGASPNVYIETGFALGRDKKKHTILLYKKENPEDKVPFDLTSYRYEQFMDTSEIPALIKPHIKEIMRQAGMNIP